MRIWLEFEAVALAGAGNRDCAVKFVAFNIWNADLRNFPYGNYLNFQAWIRR
jgi:hypothetical protein